MSTTVVKDSIERASSDTNFRSNATKRGKLMKGPCGNQTAPTIPSKYFTIVSNQSESRGFNKSSKRFQYNYTETPGPGAYMPVKSLDDKLKRASDSVKGYGGIASVATRAGLKLNPSTTPGVGAYNVAKSCSISRKDFSQGTSSAFREPIAVETDEKKQELAAAPAPGSYDPLKATKFKYHVNNVCANAAFRSRTKRELIDVKHVTNMPAPGAYNINDEILHSSIRVPFSSFKTNANRNSFIPNHDMPGPAYYRPNEPLNEPAKRQLFPRRHYLAISAPAIPMPPELPTPGPGAYEVRSFEEPEKKYMSSAAFVSCTGRWNALGGGGTTTTGGNEGLIQPGPANYSPVKPTKQSFHYNFERKWVV